MGRYSFFKETGNRRESALLRHIRCAEEPRRQDGAERAFPGPQRAGRMPASKGIPSCIAWQNNYLLEKQGARSEPAGCRRAKGIPCCIDWQNNHPATKRFIPRQTGNRRESALLRHIRCAEEPRRQDGAERAFPGPQRAGRMPASKGIPILGFISFCCIWN